MLSFSNKCGSLPEMNIKENLKILKNISMYIAENSTCMYIYE